MGGKFLKSSYETFPTNVKSTTNKTSTDMFNTNNLLTNRCLEIQYNFGNNPPKEAKDNNNSLLLLYSFNYSDTNFFKTKI